MKLIPYNKEKDGKYIEGSNPRCYVRGDIDRRGQMWTSFIPLENLELPVREALNSFTDKVINMPCMESVASLYNYCRQFPEAQTDKTDDKVYFFFSKDGFSAYLVKVICRENDYNFYINAYPLKET